MGWRSSSDLVFNKAGLVDLDLSIVAVPVAFPKLVGGVPDLLCPSTKELDLDIAGDEVLFFVQPNHPLDLFCSLNFSSRLFSNADLYLSYPSLKGLSTRLEKISSPRGLDVGGMGGMTWGVDEADFLVGAGILDVGMAGDGDEDRRVNGR